MSEEAPLFRPNQRVRFKDALGMGKYLRLTDGQEGEVLSTKGPGTSVCFDDGQVRTLWGECLEAINEDEKEKAEGTGTKNKAQPAGEGVQKAGD